MCMWEKIETIVAAAATAEEAAVSREGDRRAEGHIAALRMDGHTFKRGEASALRRTVKQAVAAEMAAPEGEKLATTLGYLRRRK